MGRFLRVMRPGDRSRRTRRVRAIAGAFRSGMPAVPILSIYRGQCAQECRGSRRRRGMRASGSIRLGCPSGAGVASRGDHLPSVTCCPVVSSHRPVPLVTCRRARGWDDGTITHRDLLERAGAPPAPAHLVGAARVNEFAQVPVKRGPCHSCDVYQLTDFPSFLRRGA